MSASVEENHTTRALLENAQGDAIHVLHSKNERPSSEIFVSGCLLGHATDQQLESRTKRLCLGSEQFDRGERPLASSHFTFFEKASELLLLSPPCIVAVK